MRKRLKCRTGRNYWKIGGLRNCVKREIGDSFDPSQIGGGELPEGFGGGMGDMPDMGSDGFPGSGSSVSGNVILYSVCFVVLVVAFVFVKRYRRRPVKR